MHSSCVWINTDFKLTIIIYVIPNLTNHKTSNRSDYHRDTALWICVYGDVQQANGYVTDGYGHDVI